MYSRELDGKIYTFGVSGKLLRDALLMYDHQTRTLWSHITGAAVEGELKGKRLTMLAGTPRITWKDWKRNHPLTEVLSAANDFRRPGKQIQEIRIDNYAMYHASPDAGISGTQYTDNRLMNKELVVGVRINESYRAYPFTAFKKQSIINDEVADEPVLAFHDLESNATAVFLRTVDGETLTFKPAQGYFVKDIKTETTWNLITGVATEGKLKGHTLKRLPAMNIYWFAWARYHPETTVYN
ncbi:DUF3179 domain-containing protein [Candidatus Poribacteria bacterium]|nr:DUF3179 domain-containing protein [Candidatus Poribacteria bacterium]